MERNCLYANGPGFCIREKCIDEDSERFVDLNTAKQVVWRLRISADDYRLAVMEMGERSRGVKDICMKDV